MTSVAFDRRVGELLLKYARMVVARGYVHNFLRNIAIRVEHPGFEHGVVYTKHAEVSLEEVTLDNVVITDVPTPRLLHGTVPTSVGHNLNREILRLRPDIQAVIHAHHDETISLFASGPVKELRPLSLEFPYVMALPPHVVPSHLDVENDVGPIREFIAGTNAVLMENHGVTTPRSSSWTSRSERWTCWGASVVSTSARGDRCRRRSSRPPASRRLARRMRPPPGCRARDFGSRACSRRS